MREVFGEAAASKICVIFSSLFLEKQTENPAPASPPVKTAQLADIQAQV
jgi:hypothetical protein